MANKRKFWVVLPPTGAFQRGEDRCQVPVKEMMATTFRMPINAAYISALLKKKGFDAEVKDYAAEKADENRALDEISKAKVTDLIIITSPFSVEKDNAFAGKVKDVTVAAYGAQFLFSTEKYVLENVNFDFVVFFDYIRVFLDFDGRWEKCPGVAYRSGKKAAVNKPNRALYDFNAVPFPDRDSLKNEIYTDPRDNEMITTVQASVGCAFRCKFCLAPVLTREWHGSRIMCRSAESIMAEIRECYERHKIKKFFLRADTFTMNKKNVLELCRMIKESGLPIKYVANSRVDTVDCDMVKELSESGCEVIAFGIETGSAKSLKRIGKTMMRPEEYFKKAEDIVRCCRRYGIKSYLFFIIGFFWETKDDIMETIRLAKRLNGDYYEFHSPVYYEGTGLFEEAGQRMKSTHTSKVSTDFVSEEEFEKLYRKAVMASYFRPRMILGVLGEIVKRPGSVKNYFEYGWKLAKRMVKRE